MTMMALTTLMLLKLHFLLGGPGGTVTERKYILNMSVGEENHIL